MAEYRPERVLFLGDDSSSTEAALAKFRVASLFADAYAEGLWSAEIASGTKVAASTIRERRNYKLSFAILRNTVRGSVELQHVRRHHTANVIEETFETTTEESDIGRACRCWCNSIETAVPWSEWYWTTQCRFPAGTWIVHQETAAQAIPQREPWPREHVVCSAYPDPFAITLAASGGCSYSFFDLSRIARILYVSDCVFLPSKLTTHSSFALSPRKSA
jgi:hypothetical protein